MAVEWFYQVMGEATGPVTSSMLKKLAGDGTICRDTLVRRSSDDRWYLAEAVSGLFEATGRSLQDAIDTSGPQPPPVQPTPTAPVEATVVSEKSATSDTAGNFKQKAKRYARNNQTVVIVASAGVILVCLILGSVLALRRSSQSRAENKTKVALQRAGFDQHNYYHGGVYDIRVSGGGENLYFAIFMDQGCTGDDRLVAMGKCLNAIEYLIGETEYEEMVSRNDVGMEAVDGNVYMHGSRNYNLVTSVHDGETENAEILMHLIRRDKRPAAASPASAIEALFDARFVDKSPVPPPYYTGKHSKAITVALDTVEHTADIQISFDTNLPPRSKGDPYYADPKSEDQYGKWLDACRWAVTATGVADAPMPDELNTWLDTAARRAWHQHENSKKETSHGTLNFEWEPGEPAAILRVTWNN